ncbi:siderophore-interacting protein [Sphingomonas sp. HITSZ_GF]|uniref:siderophore-interacting protein n=1 Tax=Sphingomonas sp. HITSZ_GF TaxID=3037247 RepID=UPI00240E2F2D|nr:siderophore-interacting protein [Sphingomonas sp. HITSZ_GF]MDG2532265.1 siderophore-interacting protein [Sphingomonas sp. HITSZ_GF]
MLAPDSPERPAPAAKAPGRIDQALRRLLMKPAAIVANEELSDRFRLITIEGPALAGVAWTPGQKLQVAMGSAFMTRTYTPIEWNSVAGRTCILGYAHGEGPGSAWVRDARPGDACDLFGPRGSLDAGRLPGTLALFGDETAIGLAYALSRQGRRITSHFEVEDSGAVCKVADQLGVGRMALYPRRAGESHVAAMEAALPALIAADAGFVLAGRAGMVQRLRHALKALGVPSSRVITKAYWAPGKTGLD